MIIILKIKEINTITYKKADLDIIYFKANDIITTSNFYEEPVFHISGVTSTTSQPSGTTTALAIPAERF